MINTQFKKLLFVVISSCSLSFSVFAENEHSNKESKAATSEKKSPSKSSEKASSSAKESESATKEVERLDNTSRAICHVTFTPGQYIIDKPTLASCFKNEIDNKSDYECLTVYASTSEAGGEELNMDLLGKRTNAALSIMKPLFSKVKNIIVERSIDTERAVYVTLHHRDQKGSCAEVSVGSGHSKSVANSESVSNSTHAASSLPIVGSETKKASIIAGGGVLFINSGGSPYVANTMANYKLSMTVDLTPEKDWGSFYGGISYMNAVTKTETAQNYTVVYSRNDIILLGGVDYNLKQTQFGKLSAFFEMGPTYATHALMLTSNASGSMYQTYIALYTATGLKIMSDSGLFARLGALSTLGHVENYINGVTISGFAFAGMLEFGYSF